MPREGWKHGVALIGLGGRLGWRLAVALLACAIAGCATRVGDEGEKDEEENEKVEWDLKGSALQLYIYILPRNQTKLVRLCGPQLYEYYYKKQA